MELFKIPHSARVQKVIPKNTFDTYTNSKQKKLFTDLVARITWLHKLSPDTVNLPAGEIKEIQIFKIELKVKQDIQTVLTVIDKAIPYNILFIVEHDQSAYLSTSPKHPHPINPDNSVIDWTFASHWFALSENIYHLSLKKNLDSVYHNICTQLSAKPDIETKSLREIIEIDKEIDSIKTEILSLRSAIAKSIQYKQRVELNIKLKAAETRLMNAYE